MSAAPLMTVRRIRLIGAQLLAGPLSDALGAGRLPGGFWDFTVRPACWRCLRPVLRC